MDRKNEMFKLINEHSFLGDDLCTTHNIDFKNQSNFSNAVSNSLDELTPSLTLNVKKDLLWRFQICLWAANKCKYVEGDFIELGVWYGVLSRAMCEYVEFGKCNKKFYLVDSWGTDGSHSNYQDDIYDVVARRFHKFGNVELIRGLVPDVLGKIPSTKIAYLAIDMNGSKPERAALEYFYDKVSPGGVIYFDDYGWGYPELRKEVDDFFKDKPEILLHFPSGNSIIIKQ